MSLWWWSRHILAADSYFFKYTQEVYKLVSNIWRHNYCGDGGFLKRVIQ